MPASESYEFGEFRLDVHERRLARRGTPVHLPPKAFDILVWLVRRGGRLISKRELLALVWPDAFVEMGIITVYISSVRKALGDVGRPARFIETVSRSGYRFTAPVHAVDAGGSLSVHADGPTRGRSRTRYTRNTDAYLLYLKGRYLWERRTDGCQLKAIEYFEAAIEKDPSYALAYSGLGACYGTLSFTSGFPPRDAFLRSRLALLRALELDDSLAEAHESLAGVKFWHDWDWAGAEEEFRCALDLAPDQPATHRFFAYFLSNLGRHEEALQHAAIALQLEPTSIVSQVRMGQFLYQARDLDAARRRLEDARKRDPDFWLSRLNLGRVYERQGDYNAALEELHAALDRASGSGEVKGVLGHALAARGRLADARRVAEELEAAQSRGLVYGYPLALIAAGSGDRDRMYAHLHAALNDRDVGLTFLRVEPRWQPFLEEPMFRAVLERVGLPASNPGVAAAV